MRSRTSSICGHKVLAQDGCFWSGGKVINNTYIIMAWLWVQQSGCNEKTAFRVEASWDFHVVELEMFSSVEHSMLAYLKGLSLSQLVDAELFL